MLLNILTGLGFIALGLFLIVINYNAQVNGNSLMDYIKSRHLNIYFSGAVCILGGIMLIIGKGH